MPAKSNSCTNCNNAVLRKKTATFPVKLGERTIEVGRVAMNICDQCGAMIPTKAGKEKIERCVSNVKAMFAEHGLDIYRVSN
jgi:YgiT-type zinc finger domain-containing protein